MAYRIGNLMVVLRVRVVENTLEYVSGKHFEKNSFSFFYCFELISSVVLLFEERAKRQDEFI